MRKLRRAMRSFRGLFGKEKPPVGLLHIYTDKQGYKWFEYADPTAMPMARELDIQIAQKQAEMCITTEMYDAFINECIKEMSAGGSAQRALDILYEMKLRREMAGEEVTLLNYAVALFLIEGEPSDKPSDGAYRKLKLEILANDKEARDFFLRAAFGCLPKYEHTLNVDIVKYLEFQSLTMARKTFSQTALQVSRSKRTDKSTT
jgi:hypothetical protein